MGRPVPDWVKVGAEVVETRYGSTFLPVATFGSIRKITAVLGNGNFRIEGRQQWSPYQDGTARETGTGYYRKTVRLITDELRAEIEQSHRYQHAAKLLSEEAKRLENLARSRDVEDIIAEADRITPARALDAA